MVGWRHRLKGCELEQTPGDTPGVLQSMSCKESDMAEGLSSNNIL